MSNLKTNLPRIIKSPDRDLTGVVERVRPAERIDLATLPFSAKLLAFFIAIIVMSMMRSRGIPVRLTPPLLLLAQRFGLPGRYGLLLKFLTRS